MSLLGDTIQAGQDLKDFIETETEGAIEGTLNGLKSIDQRFRFVILLNTALRCFLWVTNPLGLAT